MGFCPELARPLGAPALIVQAGGRAWFGRGFGWDGGPLLRGSLGGVFKPRSGALLSPNPQSSRGSPLVGHRVSADDTQRASAAAPDEEPYVPGCKHTHT